MLFLAIFIVFLAISYFSYKNKFGRRDFLLKQFPAPKGLPIFDHSLMFANKTPYEVFNLTCEIDKKFEKLYYLSFGVFDDPFIFVKDAKIVEGFLASQTILDKSVDYELLKPWIGVGLLVSTDKKWFQRRKVRNFVFETNNSKKLTEIKKNLSFDNNTFKFFS